LGDVVIAYSKTSIISQAIMLLGHKPIQTLDNADDLVISAEQAFDILLPAVLGTGNWRFAIKIEQLVLSTEVPPLQTGWNQIYLLPAGYLKNIRIIPQNYAFEIYSNSQIWCNWGTQSPVYMEFAYVPPIPTIPATFIKYFVYEIATHLALCNAQKPDYMNVLKSERDIQWAIAAATDAQNRPNFVQWEIPMLVKRNISGIVGPQIG
jgi:hypothetical protein